MRLKQNLPLFERLFEKAKTPANAIALAEHYWLMYRLADDDFQDAKTYLHKAYHAVLTTLRFNFANLELYFLQTFLLIELGNFPNADAALNNLKAYRGYLKANDRDGYSVYMFLEGLYAARSKKMKVCEKRYDQIIEANEGKTSALADTLLGMLCAELSDFPAAFAHFESARKSGGASAYLFASTYSLLKKADDGALNVSGLLFPAFFTWAMGKDAPLGFLAEKYDYALAALYPHKKELSEEYYRACHGTELLAEICLARMTNADTGEDALFFYREAVVKQIELPGLYNALIRAAYMNKYEKIGRYTLSKFFAAKELDYELLPFAYHILLTAFPDSELCRAQQANILQYGEEILYKRETGRFQNSVYRFMLDYGKCAADVVALLEKNLSDDLFKFKITVKSDKARYVWVYEREMREMRYYAMSGKTRVITSAGSALVCKFLAEDKLTLVDTEYEIARLVENADYSLCLRFFLKGFKSPELLVALSRYYMETEAQSPDALAVFRLALENGGISDAFRVRVSAGLGNFYSGRGDYKLAASYYSGVNEDYIDEKYFERMFLTYINSGEFVRAANLAVRNSEHISDKALFDGMKRLASEKLFDKAIAGLTAELCLKGWYDEGLLDLVMNHHSAALSEWQQISSALYVIGAECGRLDAMILEKAMSLRRFDRESQKIFARARFANPEDPIILEFMEYCVYEIIINSVKPEYETINILEKIFEETDYNYLCYALCHVYLLHGIETPRSDRILEKAVAMSRFDEIIFPVLRLIKDKNILTPYIEENQAFIHRTLPKRRVVLHYRVDGGPVRVKETDYLKFGLYAAAIPHFYGEEIEYWFSEELASGSVESSKAVVGSSRIRLYSIPEIAEMSKGGEGEARFALINNAAVYEHMFRYELAEGIITDMLKEKKWIKSWIM